MTHRPTADDRPTATSDEPRPSTRSRQALRDRGPGAALDRLAEHLDAAGEFRALLDALLLQGPARAGPAR